MLRKYLGSRKLKLFLAIVILVVGGKLWLNNRRAVVQSAHEFYLSGDCENAMLEYDKVFSYHSLLGEFDFAPYQDTWECAALLAAELIFGGQPLLFPSLCD